MLPYGNYYIPSPSMSEKNISNNHNDGNKRRKQKRPMTPYGGGGGGGEDDLAVVKAAAWAWYQRKESKPIKREFDLTREPRTHRPSRYKIEATKKTILFENRVFAENRVSKSSLWYTNRSFRGDQESQYSRLLDTYEIKNITKRLNIDDSSLSMSSSSLFRDKGDDHHDGNYDYSFDEHALFQKRIGYEKNRNNDKKSYSGFIKKVSKRIMWKGMVVMGPGSAVCGRSDDVDVRVSRASRRTVKVSVAADALVRSAASGKTQSGHGC